ncbi:hypothetical protein SteCoe_32162 [Stentor coeruleus]|uniref:Protein kinase domain-containing protein n=1 Tax=Stentor coeruleus TaxID=5963 RepID=A0A1R2AZT1_9CILI|nr:hypothetical protein SteCoe_32162 [Stentor coeruleus]
MSEIALPQGFIYKGQLYANSKSKVIKAAKDGKEFAIKCPLDTITINKYIETEVDIYKKNLSGIVKFYDHIIIDSNHYLIFKYYPCSLSDFIQVNPCINTHTLYRWATQIAQTMAQLHEENYIHRDLSPDNILMTSNSELADVVIADLELNINTDYKTPETHIYKRGFSAPEINKGKYDNKVDVFSFGAIIYYCLTYHTYDISNFDLIQSSTDIENGWIELMRMSLDEDYKNRKSFRDILDLLQRDEKKIKSFKRFNYLLYNIKNLNCSRIMENYLIRIALKHVPKINFFNINTYVNIEDTIKNWNEKISSMPDISSNTIKNEKNALIEEFENLIKQIQSIKIEKLARQALSALKKL